jgi:hypothetical protein
MNIVIIALFGLSLLASGCATSKKYNYDCTPKNEKLAFEIQDKRPEKEKQAEIMSLSISSDQYGIYRLGDGQVIPDRILYLSEKISERAEGKLNGKQITVSHFEIFNNQQKAMKGTALAASLGGLVGAAIYASVSPDVNAFIQVELELNTDGKSYGTKIIKGYTIDTWKGISDEQLANQIKQAMDLAVEDVLKKILSV